MANQITLCDVSPRDGIQNEKTSLSAAQRHELIRRLAAAGLRWIEVASFASPKWVPQMAGAEEVFSLSSTIPDLRPIVLVLNDRGVRARSKRWSSLHPAGRRGDGHDESEERECAA